MIRYIPNGSITCTRWKSPKMLSSVRASRTKWPFRRIIWHSSLISSLATCRLLKESNLMSMICIWNQTRIQKIISNGFISKLISKKAVKPLNLQLKILLNLLCFIPKDLSPTAAHSKTPTTTSSSKLIFRSNFTRIFIRIVTVWNLLTIFNLIKMRWNFAASHHIRSRTSTNLWILSNAKN